MNRPRVSRAGWLLALSASAAAGANPPIETQQEVTRLLAQVEGSGCEFQRNGRWHDGPAAQAHLRSKFDALVRRDLIQTTEQFIDRAASTSSLSGQPYLIRCPGAPTLTSRAWLSDELARLRGLR